MDSLTKARASLDLLQEELLASTGSGAQPLQVLMAGALPMVRQSLDDLAGPDGTLDVFLEYTIALVASLRSDGAPALFVVPGGVGPAWLYAAGSPDLPDPTGVVCVGQPVVIPGLPDWSFRVRQIDAGNVAAHQDPAASGDHRPDGLG